MRLRDVVFLAARTARSCAYAQALHEAGLIPEQVLIYGRENSGRPGQGGAEVLADSLDGLFVPDLSVALEATCERAGWSVRNEPVESINAPQIVGRLRELAPRLVIFSGYGGEIVSPDVLDQAPFLHVHSGWLPEYRGSTTIYYSILQEGHCSASALVLSADIDTGPVVARRNYPLPPSGVDVDYLYDSAIRADLMVRVLSEYASRGEVLNPLAQDEADGRDYYVIHPVLKHLAMLAIGNR